MKQTPEGLGGDIGHVEGHGFLLLRRSGIGMIFFVFLILILVLLVVFFLIVFVGVCGILLIFFRIILLLLSCGNGFLTAYVFAADAFGRVS